MIEMYEVIAFKYHSNEPVFQAEFKTYAKSKYFVSQLFWSLDQWSMNQSMSTFFAFSFSL